MPSGSKDSTELHERAVCGWREDRIGQSQMSLAIWECIPRSYAPGCVRTKRTTAAGLTSWQPESVLSTIKTELIKHHVWQTRLQRELTLVVYIGSYNSYRLYRSLNGDTPLGVLDEYNHQHVDARSTVASTCKGLRGTRGALGRRDEET
jgi:hypothetical protein